MKKELVLNIIGIILGLFGIYLFIDHITGFTPHDYFYIQNPNIKLYVGVNVVSAWADLSFFTYHTLIFFSLWLIGYHLSKILKNKKLINFFTNKALVVFVCGNYLITVVFYTIFELASGNPTFGLYSNSFEAVYNFITNILVHYILFIVVIIVFLKVNVTGEIRKKHYLLMGGYFVLYYLYVKLTGMFMYKIEWYPYPIFDILSICNLIGIKAPTNDILNSIILFFVMVTICLGYVMILYLVGILKKYTRKKTLDKKM